MKMLAVIEIALADGGTYNNVDGAPSELIDMGDKPGLNEKIEKGSMASDAHGQRLRWLLV